MITVDELYKELSERIVDIEYIDFENKTIQIKATVNPELTTIKEKSVAINVLGNKIQVWDIELNNWRLIDIARVKKVS